MFEDLVESTAVTSRSVLSLSDNVQTPSCCNVSQFLTITVDAVASLVAGQQPIDRKLTADMEHQCKSSGYVHSLVLLYVDVGCH